jgi:UDP-GlcNAc:undecaprenyl-phosphate GlcNAc-1-phosphate transferase
MAAGVLIPTVVSVSLVPEIRGLLLGLLVLLLFGVWDDRVTLGYRTKLAGQIIAVGICMLVGGLHVGALAFNGHTLPPFIGTTITFVFLVGITNAVNLADGLDGLAGGMVLLCLTAIALFAAMSGNAPVTAVALIEAGAVLGFLRFNTHPARIFMGDSGSQVLGLSVGALGLMATQGDTCVLSAALPLLLLGLPIMDTLSVMWTRIRAGKSPFTADRNHLHHRLLALGFAHRDAVLIIYVMQAGLVLLAYFLRFESDAEVIVSYFGFAFAVLALLRVALHKGWKAGHVIPVRLAGQVQEPAAADPGTSGTLAPVLAVAVMTGCLLAYSIGVIASTRTVRLDLGLTSAGLLVVLLLLMSYGKQRSVLWFERATAYVSVVLLVYLDETMTERPPLLSTLSWLCIGITGAAALIRFWVSPARRFEVTTLDLIVIFIALVMPNLPGNVQLPPDLPAGLAKAVILLYVVEMLLTTNFQRIMPRTFLAVTLAFIACRALIGLAA